MAYPTVANLKDSIRSLLTGLNLSNVTNPNLIIQRSARELTSLIAIPDTVTRTQLTLYDKVYDYPAPTGVFGQSVIDLRQQGITRNDNDFVYKYDIQRFDREKQYVGTGWEVTFENINGVQRMRVATLIPNPRVQIDTMTATTGWATGGTASGLTLDSTVFWQAPAALRLNLTAGTGTLSKTVPAFDATNYQGVGVAFLAMRIPTIANLTSVTLKLGTDSSNYYQVSGVTQGFLGAWVQNDWALTSFDFSTQTKVGSPTVTNIKYAEIDFVCSGSITNLYVGDLFWSLPSPHWAYIQTDNFFQVGSATPSSSITADSDSIVLADDAYVIFEHLSAINIAGDQGGSYATARVEELKEKLNGVRGYRGVLVQVGLLDLYRAKNPSQEIRTTGNYYDD